MTGFEETIMVSAPVYVDGVLALCLTIAAGAQYAWIAFYGSTLGRWFQALGWTGLSLRIWVSLALGEDPHIATVSIPLLIFAAGGSAITALTQMRNLWAGVKCIRDHSQPCFREDRVSKALLEKKISWW